MHGPRGAAAGLQPLRATRLIRICGDCIRWYSTVVLLKACESSTVPRSRVTKLCRYMHACAQWAPGSKVVTHLSHRKLHGARPTGLLHWISSITQSVYIGPGDTVYDPRHSAPHHHVVNRAYYRLQLSKTPGDATGPFLPKSPG